jgi:hypothetical protein
VCTFFGLQVSYIYTLVKGVYVNSSDSNEEAIDERERERETKTVDELLYIYLASQQKQA